MKNIMTILMLALAAMVSCQPFDDSELWNDVDNAYNQLTEIGKQVDALNAQVSALSAIVNNGAITGITTDADGNYVLSYKNAANEEKTIIIATKDDVASEPILGTKEEGGILYWTLTSGGKTEVLKIDGVKVPVQGVAPEFAVDSEGYWTMNGKRITDAAGQPVKAEGKTVSLITGVAQDENGNGVITLADGSTVTVPFFDAFSLNLSVGGQAVIAEIKFETFSPTIEIDCVVTGKNAETTVLKVMKQTDLTAVYDAATKKITVTLGDGFEQGSFVVMLADAEGNVLIRPVQVVWTAAVPEYYGIKTAEDFEKFAQAVCMGKKLDRYRNTEGEIVLLNDIDMKDVTDITPAGTADSPFSDIFNGQGFKIQNVSLKKDVTGLTEYALFGYAKNATIKNLVAGADGDRIELTGVAENFASAGIVAVAEGAAILNCTNNIDVHLSGDNTHGKLACLGGIAGKGISSTIGKSDAPCVNNGDITTGKISNKGNGGSGMQVGGICAFVDSADGMVITDCTNNGHIAAPAGRGGGIVGTFNNGKMQRCTNAGLVEDDVLGQHAAMDDRYNYKRMGGLSGSAGASATIDQCTNKGIVITHLSCRTGGFVGHNEGKITNSYSEGIVIGDVVTAGSNYHGAGWACGFNKSMSLVDNCHAEKGRCGDYKYKDNPSEAPFNTINRAVAHKMSTFDPEINYVDWTLPSYYDWTEKSSKMLHSAVKYTYYEFDNLPRKMHVIEMDLTSNEVEITTSFANDIVPNPNGNNNDNGGPIRIREMLSENAARKVAEGNNMIVGFNTGFFNSHYGFPRGLHIENGRADFINNLDVRNQLNNHDNAFTYFKDGTASCGVKRFSGKIQWSDKEIEYYAVNDTILRKGDAKLLANVYTNKYKEIPHADHPHLKNILCPDALYIVAENVNKDGSCIQVNADWIEAKVVSVHDGRTTALAKAPYIDSPDQWVVQLTGQSAEDFAGAKAGDVIKIMAEVKVDGVVKPILTQNSTMLHLVKNGQDRSHVNMKNGYPLYDPMTYVGISQDEKKVYFIIIDGRQDWVSMGVHFFEMSQIAIKLGCYNVTRFDGGGSTTLWINDGTGGKVVNKPSDDKGERSCMNYMYIRVK